MPGLWQSLDLSRQWNSCPLQGVPYLCQLSRENVCLENFSRLLTLNTFLLVETVARRDLPAECENFNYCGSPCILVPPTSTCLICPTAPLLSVHHECSVVVHGFGGAKQATKISTRCQACRGIYNYSNYGNASSGWNLYAGQRDYVEASDLCFVERRMYKLQCSLAYVSYKTYIYILSV